MPDPPLTDRCLQLIVEGKKILAIVALREDLGISLAQSIELVEAEFAKHAGDRESKLIAAGLTQVVHVSIRDGLELANGAFAPGPQACEIYCRVFDDWIEKEQLAPARIEAFYEYLYGRAWRSGNEDGSRYLPVETLSKVLTGEEKASKPWTAALSSHYVQFWFCYANQEGSLERVDKSRF